MKFFGTFCLIDIEVLDAKSILLDADSTNTHKYGGWEFELYFSLFL
jgi:hypothetical protein